MRRFCEFYFDCDRIKLCIKNKTTGFVLSRKEDYEHFERLLITACFVVIENNIQLFKIVYGDYLKTRRRFIGLKRDLWLDFHKTLISHCIWINNESIVIWIWTQIRSYIRELKLSYPNISKWREQWYITHLKTLREYILHYLLSIKKINSINLFISKNILVHMHSKKNSTLLKDYGYIYHNRIILEDVSKNNERMYMKSRHEFDRNFVCNLDLEKCLDYCHKNDKGKKIRFLHIFKERPTEFWDFFLNLDPKKATLLGFNNIIDFLKKNKIEISEKQKHSVVEHAIKNHKFITKGFIKYIHGYGYTISTLECTDLISRESIFDSKFEEEHKFLFIIKFLVSNDGKRRIPNCVTATEAFWFNKLFSIKFLRQQLKFFYNGDICPICIQETTENLVHVACGHVLHRSCLNAYLKHQKNAFNCPICRVRLSPEIVFESVAHES